MRYQRKGCCLLNLCSHLGLPLSARVCAMLRMEDIDKGMQFHHEICTKNKDLQRGHIMRFKTAVGTKIHNELQKRGLADKDYSAALVTMYTKCGELHAVSFRNHKNYMACITAAINICREVPKYIMSFRKEV